MTKLIEELSAEVHETWRHWMRYLFSQGTIMNCDFMKVMMTINEVQETSDFHLPRDKYNRWTRQMNTPYAELSEEEKESDREFARKYIRIVTQNLYNEFQEYLNDDTKFSTFSNSYYEFMKLKLFKEDDVE